MRARVIAGHLVLERTPRAPRGRRWVLLHGFTQAPATFAPLIERLSDATPTAAITLPGHGPLPRANPRKSFARTVDELAGVLRALGGPCAVLGYSLGARLGYGLAARHPHLVHRLVAVAGHPGLDEASRDERQRSDAALAQRLRAQGLEAFLESWSKLPLFATQAGLPPAYLARQARARRGHDASALADGLEQLSLARMPAWQAGLRRFPGRLDLVVGARDHKFCGLAQALLPRLPQGRLTVVPGAGHNVVLEAPAAVARVMRVQI